jgi:putative alpha-1,2-mannosidase
LHLLEIEMQLTRAQEYKNIYIQNATLNGEPYSKNWIGHEFFTQGWTLELTLGDTESEWGTKKDDLPPSLSSTTGASRIL